MLRARRSCSPSRRPPPSHSPTRPSPVKGGSYECELIRVQRERDEMQNMLEKYERHLSEIQASVKVLTADRDKTRMHYQQAQEEMASLRRQVLTSRSSRASKSSATASAQGILDRVQAERDQAAVDLDRMSTERDSLRERLKISQETAISERAHLEQKAEDLQTAIATLEQERCDHMSRLATVRGTAMGLEKEIHTLGRKLTSAEEELSRTRNECGILRLSNSEVQNALSDTQRRLTSRIGELQNYHERNKLLDEKNDSLLRQESDLRQEVGGLESTITNLTQNRDSLDNQLEEKADLLSSAQEQLDDNEKTIRNLRLTIEELETSAENVRGVLMGRERELEASRRRLDETEEELRAMVTVKDATLMENSQLQEELDKTRLDNQALELKSEDSAQEVQELQKKVQDYVADVSHIENLLSTKERECRDHQEAHWRVSAQAERWEGSVSKLRSELITSDAERRQFQEKVESLEARLQEVLRAERSSIGQVSQLNSGLLHAEGELRKALGERSATQTDLDKTRELCVKLDAGKESLKRELDTCRSEVELLREQLSSERLNARSLESVSAREAEVHRGRSRQERTSQGREVATLRTRVARLEADLDMTRRQLSTERFERERAVQELRRQGLSCSSSGMRSSSPPLRHSLSPCRPPVSTRDLPAQDRSPERWAHSLNTSC